jgi:predicted RND superfamily exporter protein
MTGGDEVPKNRGLILLLSRYLKLINGQGIDGAFISDDYNIMSIYMTVYNAEDRKFVTEKDIEKLNSEISAILGKYLPDDVESEVWGDTILFLASSRIMSREQVFSTLLSLLMVFLVTSFIFKSVKFGLISLIPLCFGIMCYYITVSLLRIPMDMTTIIVTNIAIGVGVDDSIHFLLQFRKQYKHDLPIALKNTFSIAGRPIALTTISIVSGLAILCFAQFKPVMHFGLLVSVCLLAAMIGTFLFLPVFIKLIHLKAFENPTGRS